MYSLACCCEILYQQFNHSFVSCDFSWPRTSWRIEINPWFDLHNISLKSKKHLLFHYLLYTSRKILVYLVWAGSPELSSVLAPRNKGSLRQWWVHDRCTSPACFISLWTWFMMEFKSIYKKIVRESFKINQTWNW